MISKKIIQIASIALLALGCVMIVAIAFHFRNKYNKCLIQNFNLKQENGDILKEHSFIFKFIFYWRQNDINLNSENHFVHSLESTNNKEKELFFWMYNRECSKCVITAISTLKPFLELNNIKLNIIIQGQPVLDIPNYSFIKYWSSNVPNPTLSLLNEEISFFFTIDEDNFPFNVQLLERETSIDMDEYLRLLQLFFKSET